MSASTEGESKWGVIGGAWPAKGPMRGARHIEDFEDFKKSYEGGFKSTEPKRISLLRLKDSKGDIYTLRKGYGGLRNEVIISSDNNTIGLEYELRLAEYNVVGIISWINYINEVDHEEILIIRSDTSGHELCRIVPNKLNSKFTAYNFIIRSDNFNYKLRFFQDDLMELLSIIDEYMATGELNDMIL